MCVEEKMQRNAEILFEEYGQRLSISQQLPVDKEGRPIPWYTYPFIEYISSFQTGSACVFEYGCGHSSLYWAGRAKFVWSVEHDSGWIETVRQKAPENLELRLREEETAYVDTIRENGGRFDLIIVDGRWRRKCAAQAAACLAPGGLIIFDNSDWYPGACSDLRNLGFFQCDFSGFGPVNNYTWTTSLFLRANTRLQGGFVNPLPRGGWRTVNDDKE